MTKSDFLIELEKKLKSLSSEERAKTINYYSEMISDMIDSGLTQEEATAKLGSPNAIAEEIIENAREHKKQNTVEADPTFTEIKKETPVQQELKNTKKVKAWPFVLLGVLVLIIFVGIYVGGSIYFSRLPREKQVKEFAVESVNAISIDVEVDGLTVIETNDDKIVFEYYSNKRHQYEVEQEGSTLEIDADFNYGFFSDFSIEDHNTKNTKLYLPKSYNRDFEYDGSTGAIYFETTHSLNKVDIEISTGLASIKNLTCVDLDVYQSTGSVEILNVTTNSAFIKASTGSIRVENSRFNELIIDQGTGPTKIKNITGLTAEINKVIIEASTGEVEFDNINALNISIHVSTGDVEGRFNDSMSNYTITSKVSTGDNNLPQSFGNGPKKLDVKTSTGDIEVYFAD